MDTNKNQKTLTDIFLEVLPQNSNPDMQTMIERIKITLKIPERGIIQCRFNQCNGLQKQHK